MDPHHDARYAGVLRWRTMVDEQAMPRNVTLPRAGKAADAAHAASPMVGGGFRQGLYDVQALAQAMTAAGSPAEVPGALARYSKARLAAAIRHVTRSEQETAAYLAHAASSCAGPAGARPGACGRSAGDGSRAWWQASWRNALITRNMTQTEGPDDDCHSS